MDGIKYSFIMPYHRRTHQFQCTLESFLHHYDGVRQDFEVIVVEDMKNHFDVDEHARLVDLVRLYSRFFSIVMVVGGTLENWNPAPLFNVGVALAKGDYLIITNPECMHKDSVLNALDEEFSKEPNAYVMMACLSVPVSIMEVQNMPFADGKWYQHSIHRNILCHFCAALSKSNYYAIGGFDNGFAGGVCFEDDDFRNKVLKARLPLVLRDDVVVIHLSHSKSKAPDFLRRHSINKMYYESVWGKDCLKAETMKVE